MATYSGDNNYVSSSSSNGTLTLTADTQTITFGALASVVYGVSPLTLKGTSNSGLPVSYAITSGPATVSGSTLTVTGAGTVVIVASQPGNGTYSAASPVTQNLTVSKAPLTVTANSLSLLAGSTIPTLTGTLTGVVNNDSITASYTTTATSASAPGTYTITPKLADPNSRLGNYTVASNNGTLTLTGTAPITASISYVYDTQGRLVSVTYKTASRTITTSYSYDNNGNRLSVSVVQQ